EARLAVEINAGKFDGRLAPGSGSDFRDGAPAERGEVHGRRLTFHLARIDFAEEQNLFDKVAHAATGIHDVAEELPALLFGKSRKVALKVSRRRGDNAKRCAELVRNQRDEAAFELAHVALNLKVALVLAGQCLGVREGFDQLPMPAQSEERDQR